VHSDYSTAIQPQSTFNYLNARPIFLPGSNIQALGFPNFPSQAQTFDNYQQWNVSITNNLINWNSTIPPTSMQVSAIEDSYMIGIQQQLPRQPSQQLQAFFLTSIIDINPSSQSINPGQHSNVNFSPLLTVTMMNLGPPNSSKPNSPAPTTNWLGDSYTDPTSLQTVLPQSSIPSTTAFSSPSNPMNMTSQPCPQRLLLPKEPTSLAAPSISSIQQPSISPVLKDSYSLIAIQGDPSSEASKQKRKANSLISITQPSTKQKGVKFPLPTNLVRPTSPREKQKPYLMCRIYKKKISST
jgi:hypothetical protein